MGERPSAIAEIVFAEDEIAFVLDDGARVRAPLARFPRLAGASAEARANWRLSPSRRGVHWPDLDEDLSLDGFLTDRAPRALHSAT
jgi:Protein of unknown function (DUF2442)